MAQFCRTNLLHGTFVGACLVVALLFALRSVPLPAFLLLVAAPCIIGQGLFGMRTHPFKLAGKTVLVTGASSGLGAALAVAAARRGAARVICVARREAALRVTATKVEAAGAAAVVLANVDLGDPAAAERCRAQLEPAGETVDMVVNNAGGGSWKRVVDMPAAEAAAAAGCPYLSSFATTRAFLPGMVARGRGGHVLNVSSLCGYVGFRGASAYASARWAVRGFTECLRPEVADDGIGVTLLSPMRIRGTNYEAANEIDAAHLPWLFGLALAAGAEGRVTADQVAEAALDGVEAGESEVHVPGPVAFPVVWASGLAPWLLTAAVEFRPPRALMSLLSSLLGVGRRHGPGSGPAGEQQPSGSSSRGLEKNKKKKAR